MLAKDGRRRFRILMYTAIYFSMWNAKLWAAHASYQHGDAFSERLFFDYSTSVLGVAWFFEGMAMYYMWLERREVEARRRK